LLSLCLAASFEAKAEAHLWIQFPLTEKLFFIRGTMCAFSQVGAFFQIAEQEASVGFSPARSGTKALRCVVPDENS